MKVLSKIAKMIRILSDLMATNRKHFIPYGVSLFLIIIVTLMLFFRHTSNSETLLSSPSSLAYLLSSPPEQPYLWQNHYWPGMRYRVLFHFIVETTSSLIKSEDPWTFYWSFVGWSFLFTCGILFALWEWLHILAFSVWQRLVGCLFFLFSFPVLFAYDYPVFTREDPLAYLLVVLSLIAVTNSHYPSFMILTTLGAMTRETTMVVPFCHLLIGPGTFRARLLHILPSCVVFLLLRALLGFQSYNPFIGARVNFYRPLEAAIFLFLSFGVIWLLAIIRWSELWKNRGLLLGKRRTVYSYTPIAVVSILFTNFALAVVRENRISFLLFPFMIPWAVDWIKSHANQLRGLLHNRLFLTSWAVITLSAGIVSHLILRSPEWIGSTLPMSIKASLVGSHTTIARLLNSYPDIRWWTPYLVLQSMLVLMIVAHYMRQSSGTISRYIANDK